MEEKKPTPKLKKEPNHKIKFSLAADNSVVVVAVVGLPKDSGTKKLTLSGEDVL